MGGGGGVHTWGCSDQWIHREEILWGNLGGCLESDQTTPAILGSLGHWEAMPVPFSGGEAACLSGRAWVLGGLGGCNLPALTSYYSWGHLTHLTASAAPENHLSPLPAYLLAWIS